MSTFRSYGNSLRVSNVRGEFREQSDTQASCEIAALSQARARVTQKRCASFVSGWRAQLRHTLANARYSSALGVSRSSIGALARLFVTAPCAGSARDFDSVPISSRSGRQSPLCTSRSTYLFRLPHQKPFFNLLSQGRGSKPPNMPRTNDTSGRPACLSDFFIAAPRPLAPDDLPHPRWAKGPACAAIKKSGTRPNAE